MELRIVKNGQTSTSVGVATIHDGQTRVWEALAGVFDQSYKEGFDVFEHINLYWASLPKVTQDQIFNVYVRMSDVFQQFLTQEPLAMALRPLIYELFLLHPQESMQYFVALKTDIQTPPSIKTAFIQGVMPGTPERTYLKDDYNKLVPLSITMRIMIPVWGMFIYHSKGELGTIFKEYQAFQLLSHSTIVKSEAMIRLSTFVEHIISRDHPLDAAIITGISTEDFPTWVMAHTVVRRLCYADVRGLDQKGSSLVTYLYNFIEQKISSLDSQIGTIKPKHSESSSGDGENNLSKLEGYKIKQAVPTGDIALVSVYIQNAIQHAMKSKKDQALIEPNNLIRRLSQDPSFPTLVKQAYGSASNFMRDRITNPQATMAGWILSEWIPIRSLPYLARTDVVGMIALAQAYLWQNKHYDLAVLITASARTSGREDSQVISDSKVKLPKELVEELVSSYPYPRRTNSRAKNVRMFNSTLESIEDITEKLSQYNWTSNLPVAWNIGPDYVQGSRYILPFDLRKKIGVLIKEVNDHLGETLTKNNPVIVI